MPEVLPAAPPVVPPVVLLVVAPVWVEPEGQFEDPELEVDPLVWPVPVLEEPDAAFGSVEVVLPVVAPPVGFVIVPLFCCSFIPPPVVPVVLPVVWELVPVARSLESGTPPVRSEVVDPLVPVVVWFWSWLLLWEFTVPDVPDWATAMPAVSNRTELANKSLFIVGDSPGPSCSLGSGDAQQFRNGCNVEGLPTGIECPLCSESQPPRALEDSPALKCFIVRRI